MVGEMSRWQEADTGRRRLAVCLTGQLRLFMLSFPSVVQHLLSSASASYEVDLFYAGPEDESFAIGAPWLMQLPRLRGLALYSPRLRFRASRTAPLLNLSIHDSRTGRVRPTFNIFGLYQRRRFWRCPKQPTRSRLVQALQVCSVGWPDLGGACQIREAASRLAAPL